MSKSSVDWSGKIPASQSPFKRGVVRTKEWVNDIEDCVLQMGNDTREQEGNA